jgi:uncharacterized iron-regulated membrane protein
MNRLIVNKLHRYVGIVIAPFLVIQTLSGLLLEYGLFRRAGALLEGGQSPVSGGHWNPLLVKIHFGPGLASDIYHLLLGAGICWMAISGWVLFLRLRRARKRAAGGGE